MEGKNRQTRIEPSKSAQEGGNTFWKKRIIDKVDEPMAESLDTSQKIQHTAADLTKFKIPRLAITPKNKRENKSVNKEENMCDIR